MEVNSLNSDKLPGRFLNSLDRRLGSAVNSSIDQGEFRAMKMLSVCIALRSDKDQLCDKFTMST